MTEYRPGRQSEDLIVAEFHGATVRLHKSGDDLAELLLTASGNAGNAEYLAAVKVEGHSVEKRNSLHGLLLKSADGKHGLFAQLLLRALDIQGYRTPHHHLGELLRGGIRSNCGSYGLALAQHGNTVGDLHYLRQLVGDDDYAAALLLHFAQYRKKSLYLLGSEHGCRLVEDKHISAAIEDLHDLHGLLLADGHVIDLFVRVDGNTVFLTQLQYAVGGFLLAEEQPLLLPDDDIFAGGKHVNQLEVLMYHTDTSLDGVLRRVEYNFFSADLDLAAVGGIYSAEHVYEGALSGAVLAEQCEYFTLVHFKTHVLVRLDAAESLADIG